MQFRDSKTSHNKQECRDPHTHIEVKNNLCTAGHLFIANIKRWEIEKIFGTDVVETFPKQIPR